LKVVSFFRATDIFMYPLLSFSFVVVSCHLAN